MHVGEPHRVRVGTERIAEQVDLVGVTATITGSPARDSLTDEGERATREVLPARVHQCFVLERVRAHSNLEGTVRGMPHTVVNLMQIKDLAPDHGLAPGLESRFARVPLELTNSGLSHFRIGPDFRVPFGHVHSEQEEVYVVVEGSARVKLDDEVLELGTWDAVRIPPGTLARHGGRARGRAAPGLRRAEHGEQGRRDAARMVELTAGAAAAREALRARLAELSDLDAIARLANWDQRTMMPPGGGPARAHQLATLERLAHERGTADEVGEWLEALEGERRRARRDSTATSCASRGATGIARGACPATSPPSCARPAAEGQDVWQAARAAGDFAAFAPALRRNVDLARAYAACFDEAATPYDALLADYDFGLTAARIDEVFARLAEALPALVARGRRAPAPPDPRRADRRAAGRRRRGARAGVGATTPGWRIDVSAAPVHRRGVGRRHPPDHALRRTASSSRCSRRCTSSATGCTSAQVAPELARTNLGHGTSMSIHESQSKLWENHVGRHPRVRRACSPPSSPAGGFAVDAGDAARGAHRGAAVAHPRLAPTR